MRNAYTAGLQNRKGRDHLEDQGLDVNVLLMDLKDVVYGSMDWIYLTQDRNQWRVLVTVMKYQVP
jgi:nicotinamide mononucleotide adenylyltransferase